MDRNMQLLEFLEYEHNSHYYIEADHHYNIVRERLFDLVKTEQPEVIIKAGLGNGQLLIELAQQSDAYIVVVDHSYANISDFMNEYQGSDGFDKISYIVGDFAAMPVDYYAANLLICIDTLNIVESSKVIDEFRRIIDFDDLFFVGSVVAQEDDDEGIYDELMRLLLPIHNDYYIEDDLKTFLGLNQLTFVKGNFSTNIIDLNKRIDYFADFAKLDKQVINEFITGNQKEFSALYNLKDNTITEPYFTGVFRRRKPDPVNVDIYDKKQ